MVKINVFSTNIESMIPSDPIAKFIRGSRIPLDPLINLGEGFLDPIGFAMNNDSGSVNPRISGTGMIILRHYNNVLYDL